MTDVEHAKKYAEESISLAISMYNPKAEIIAETACLYGLTYKNEQIAELEKENAELKKDKEELCHSISEGGKACVYLNGQLTKAKEIILRLYNAGRDVLMCRAEEKAYDSLSNAINDKSIEQFLSKVEK